MLILNFLNYLKLKNRKGAAVLETVLILIVAIVVIAVLINFFTSGENSIVTQIYKRILSLLGITPTATPTPQPPGGGE